MKTITAIIIAAVFAAVSSSGFAQDYPDEYLGLPGDNLNLYAVMDIFQESETLESFERKLNDEEFTINNLDLNGDNYVDYITVSDYVEGNVHTIVLRTALNSREQQDIAVFVVQKLRNGEVQIQLIGDEALYGPNYIVEPIYAETPNPGYHGNTVRRNVNVVTTTYYDIAAWPVIRYIYRPGYVVWRSHWYYGYYPTYWRPWRPYYWHYYYGYHTHLHNHYYRHYRHWDHYRCRAYKTHYHSHVRVYSPTVVVNINNNRYRTTYSRPDYRSAGERRFLTSASTRQRSHATVSGESRTSRSEAVGNGRRSTSTATANRSRSSVNTNTRSTRATDARTATRGTSRSHASSQQQSSRSSATRSAGTRSSQDVRGSRDAKDGSSFTRGSSSRSSSAVQSRSDRGSSTARSSSSSSNSSSVNRGTTSRSSSAVQGRRSDRSSSAMRSSNSSSGSKSSVSSSRSSRASTPSVSRSSSRKSSSPSVSRSSSRSSSPSVSRSSSSRSPRR